MQPVQKASNIGSATLKHLKRASEKDNFLACLRPKSSNGGKRVDMLWFNFILGSNFLSFCFKLIIMLLSYITMPKNKRKENLNPVVCRGFQTKEDSDSPPLSLSGNSLVTHSISSQHCYTDCYLVLQKSQSVPISPFSLQPSFDIHTYMFSISQWLFVRDPYIDLYLLFIRDSD